MPLDPDQIELLERRLVENITPQVRGGLFKHYGTIIFTSLGLLGILGINVGVLLKAEYDEAVSNIEDKVDTNIDEKIKQSKGKIENFDKEIERLFGELEYAKKKVASQQLKVDDALESASESIAKIEGKVGDVEAVYADIEMLQARLKSLSSDAASASEKSNSLARLPGEIDKLAKALEAALNSIKSSSNIPPDPAVDQALSAVSSIKKSSEQIGKDILNIAEKTTVYLQYNGFDRATAREIAQKLSGDNYRFPDVDQEVMSKKGQFKIYFYHRNDESRANELKGSANTEVSRALGINNVSFSVEDRSDWSKKTPPGTIEIWIGKPTATQ